MNKIYFSLTACDITVPDTVYTGSALKPAAVIKDGETAFKADTDFTITYAENISARLPMSMVTAKSTQRMHQRSNRI